MTSKHSAHRDHSELILGVRAGLAVFTMRRSDILRVGFSRSIKDEVVGLTRWAAVQGVPCDELPEKELDRIADSTHHEGLLVAARSRRWATPNEVVECLVHTKGTAVALDRVRNAYNVGAILRSAAFFGVDAVVLGTQAQHPALAPTAVRVAEGGVESLLLSRTTNLVETLGRLRARGVRVVGGDGSAQTSAAGFPWRRPTVLVLGNERGGLGERIRTQCDDIVAVRGSGSVESLNVAVAAGVLLAELVRGV